MTEWVYYVVKTDEIITCTSEEKWFFSVFKDSFLLLSKLKPKTKFDLDPDFRKNPPESGPYCVRCQRPINNLSKAVKVTVDWDKWTLTKGGSELVGKNCWLVITKLKIDNKKSEG